MIKIYGQNVHLRSFIVSFIRSEDNLKILLVFYFKVPHSTTILTQLNLSSSKIYPPGNVLKYLFCIFKCFILSGNISSSNLVKFCYSLIFYHLGTTKIYFPYRFIALDGFFSSVCFLFFLKEKKNYFMCCLI